MPTLIGFVDGLDVQLFHVLIVAPCPAKTALHRTRADIVRKAIEYYLEDFKDLNLALFALRDPADAVLDWDTVKRDLLSQH